MDTFWRDIRFGARSLIRSPGFTIIAALTLTFGIGANAAFFRILDIFALNPIPWEDPASIVSLWEIDRRRAENWRGVSTAKFPEWREQTRSFEDLVAARWSSFNLTDRDELEVVAGAQVTANAFSLLGVRPLLGRGFLAEEESPRASAVAILSYRLWQRRFGMDPDIVGREIEIDEGPVTIVGVLSRTGWFPWPSAQLLTPLRLGAKSVSRTDHSLDVYGRLAPGATISQAQSEMDLVARRLADHYPETDREWQARVRYTRELQRGGSNATASFLTMGAVAMVLLIACMNVANLQLARAAARQKEIAIRSALGATRGQILRQLLAENVLLALIALPFSLLVARWTFDWILAIVGAIDVDWLRPLFQVDQRVVVPAVVISLSTVLLSGLTPALKASKTDLTSDLKQGGERGSHGIGGLRLRSCLVVAQIAFSLGLIVSAGLLIQRSTRMQSLDAGFRTANLLTLSVALPEQRYPEPEHWRTFQRELLTRLEALPGVMSAAAGASVPFGGYSIEDFTVRGRPLGTQDEPPLALWTSVSTGYFDTLGQRLVRGRNFGESDREGSVPVVIVSESLVRRHFGDASPLGKYLVLEDGEEREIVGVVGDVGQFRAWEPVTELQMYEPYAQRPSANMSVVLRTEGPPLSLGPAVRREIRAIDSRLPVFIVVSMERLIENHMNMPQALTDILATLAGVALLLTIVGVYGIVSYSTSRRLGEFGIRAALGADSRAIAGLVLRQAGVLSAWGVAIGLLLALGIGQVLSTMLYETEAFDPLTFAALSLLLAAVTLGASVVPAVRAIRTDPMVALQAE